MTTARQGFPVRAQVLRWYPVEHDGLTFRVRASSLEAARYLFGLWIVHPVEVDWIERDWGKR